MIYGCNKKIKFGTLKLIKRDEHRINKFQDLCKLRDCKNCHCLQQTACENFLLSSRQKSAVDFAITTQFRLNFHQPSSSLIKFLTEASAKHSPQDTKFMYDMEIETFFSLPAQKLLP